MAGQTGLRISRFLVICAVATSALSGIVTARVSRDQTAIKSLWTAYKSAMARRDGATVAGLLSANTIAYYEKIRKLALYAPARRLSSYRIIDRVLVYQIRHFHRAAKVTSMTAREIIAWSIGAGLSSSEAIKAMDIGTIEVSGTVGSAPATHNGRRIGWKFKFVRESGKWRLDLMPLLDRGAAAFQRVARQRNLTDEAILTQGLKDRSRKKIDMKQLAKPLIPRSGPSVTVEKAPKPSATFKDCAQCPQMVVIPAGTFVMGSPPGEEGRRKSEGPQHRVTVRRFAIGKYEVTFAQWDACQAAGGCSHRPKDLGMGRGNRPVINVSWNDAKQYVVWLSKKTGKRYRLPSEAEWEYAARAGTQTRFWWGNALGRGNTNCKRCGSPWEKKGTSPVGSFRPNRFGLYDVHGNVSEWVEDCWHKSYAGAPANGRPRTTGGSCSEPYSLFRDRVKRGGSFLINHRFLRAAFRRGATTLPGTSILGSVLPGRSREMEAAKMKSCHIWTAHKVKQFQEFLYGWRTTCHYNFNLVQVNLTKSFGLIAPEDLAWHVFGAASAGVQERPGIWASAVTTAQVGVKT